MALWLSRCSLVLVVVAAAAACDRDDSQLRPEPSAADGSQSPPSGPPATAQRRWLGATDFCRLIYEAPKRHLASSCTAEQKTTATYRELVAIAERPTQTCWKMLNKGVQAGRLRLLEANATACARALEAKSWKETLATRSLAHVVECRDLVVGLQGSGQPCRVSAECQPGLYCAGARADTEGACSKPPAEGSDCEAPAYVLLGELAAACRPGSFCDGPERVPRYARGLAAINIATETGVGGGSGRLGKRRVRPPRVRMSTVSVSGRLPPEVIQRIVRQNYGRFRLCYEDGLRANPNLEGRVVVRFVIGRDGSVSSVGGGGDLPDGGVVSCVTRAFYGLSFPQPEGGIVTVSYPLVFSPGSGAVSPSSSGSGSGGPRVSTYTCAAVKNEGEGCFATRQCAEGLRCRTGKCSQPPGEGDDCLDDADCQQGSFCALEQAPGDAGVESQEPVAGVCSPALAAGSECERHLQCQGACSARKCVSFCR